MKAVVRNGFTLIEVIVVLVIMAILVGTAVLNVGRGLKSARLQEAGRVVTQYARHARALALLKGKPTVLTIEEVQEDGEFAKSRISIAYSTAVAAQSGSSLMMAGGQTIGAGPMRTISGRLVTEEGVSEEMAALTGSVEGDGADDAVEDPLSAPPRTFEGIRVKGMLQENFEEKRARISVFSNVDYLKRGSAETAARKDATKADGDKKDTHASEKEVEESVDEESSFSAVYEVNGRCEPWKVKLWRDGTDEDDALEISFGRFGRVVTPEK